MSRGTMIILKQNKLMRLFRSNSAVDEEHGICIDYYGIRRNFIFNRMVARGVFIENQPGKFFMDERAADDFVDARRKRGAAALLALFVIIFIYYLVK